MANRTRTKNRRDKGSFLALPHSILNHPNYCNLSPRAVKLLIDLAVQYNGYNNGDLACTFKMMKSRGWTSNDQLLKAKNELLAKAWIVLSRQGGRNRCNLYAVTFHSIDECKGKLDIGSTNTPLGYWKNASDSAKLVFLDRHRA